MPSRREVIEGTTLLLIASAPLVWPLATVKRRLITEAALTQPQDGARAILLSHAEPLGSRFLGTLPTDRYAARLSPANQLLLREMLRDRRIRIAESGEHLMFKWQG